MKQRKTTFEEYDVIKTMAILLIVIAHSSQIYSYIDEFKDINGGAFLQFIFAGYPVVSIYLPILVFVSGAIYYSMRVEMKKYNNRVGFIDNKMKRLLIPYAFFSILIVFPTLLFLDKIDGNPFMYFIKNILLGYAPKHLWYVLMLFFVFFLFYFLEPIIMKLKFWHIFPILFIIHVIGVIYPGYLQFGSAMGYLIYFYLGYFFQQNKESILKHIQMKTTFIISLTISVSAYIAYYYLFQKGYSFIFRYPIFFISSMSGIVYFYITSCWISSTSLVKTKTYQIFKKNSFAIYLLHYMYLYLIIDVLRNYEINNGIILTTCLTIVLVAISLASAFAIRKLKLQVVLGE